MPQEFQTSFIPKKTFDAGQPARTRETSLSGIISLIAAVIFAISLAGAAGVFLYERFLIASIGSKKESLERAKNAFEPELIRELSRLDDKLRISHELLNGHLAPSGIFDLLEDVTLETVRFNSMSYMIEEEGIKLALEGEAVSFASVALQSDEFGKHRFVREPVFSGLELDEQGNVEFAVSAFLDPVLLSYRDRTARAGSARFETEVAPAAASDARDESFEATTTDPF